MIADQIRAAIVEDHDGDADAWFEATDRSLWDQADYQTAIAAITSLRAEHTAEVEMFAVEAGARFRGAS